MGLYTQQDPIGIAGGLNLYGYANGDPINFSDPFGLFAEGPCDGIEDNQEWAKCKVQQYQDEDARGAWESENPFESWFMENTQCLASASAATAAFAGDVLLGVAVVGGVAAAGAVRASAPVVGAAWRAGAYDAATTLIGSGNALVGQAARASGTSAMTRGAGAAFNEVNGGNPSVGGFLQRTLTFQGPRAVPAAAQACSGN
jgi:uncharacterized protein RhaS with RHS repeats